MLDRIQLTAAATSASFSQAIDHFRKEGWTDSPIHDNNAQNVFLRKLGDQRKAARSEILALGYTARAEPAWYVNRTQRAAIAIAPTQRGANAGYTVLCFMGDWD